MQALDQHFYELRHAHPDLRHGGGEPNLVLGYGGMVSFGHAAFFGAGAYIVGILAAEGVTSLWLAWPLAIAVAALAAAAIGAVSLRTRGVYFIMITLAFAQMMYYVFVSLKAYGGDDGFRFPALHRARREPVERRPLVLPGSRRACGSSLSAPPPGAFVSAA